MLPLLLAGIVFFFLLLGSSVFLLCLLVPHGRQYALSAALWCAVWGPCSALLMLIAGAGLIVAAFVANTSAVPTFHAPRLLPVFGWSYLVVGIVVTSTVATGAAWIHQWLIERMTFALFRLYAALVSAGIGSVFGWCLGWWMESKNLSGYGWFFLWGFCMLALIAAFSIAAYNRARDLRGKAPAGFTWISQEEYAG